jgi:hypothetical protein
MDLDLTRLATLKDKLIHAGNFNEVFNYFFDHFGENASFIALGERVDDAFLEAVIRQVAGELFPGEVQLQQMLLTRLPEYGFIHGGFTVNGCLGNVLYFEDIRTGLLAIVTSFFPSETKLARFTGKPMQDSWKRSTN